MFVNASPSLWDTVFVNASLLLEDHSVCERKSIAVEITQSNLLVALFWQILFMRLPSKQSLNEYRSEKNLIVCQDTVVSGACCIVLLSTFVCGEACACFLIMFQK